MNEGLRFGDRLPSGRLVVHVLGTVVLASALVTARPDGQVVLVWLAMGASFGAWLASVVLTTRRPDLAVLATAAASLLAAPVSGSEAAGGMVLVCVSLGVFAANPLPRVPAILALAVADAVLVLGSSLLWHRTLLATLINLGALPLAMLLALNRRQHVVQARQTELLLAQTQLAQHEQARAAALDERARIAREMHDVLAHSLGALGVQLEVAEALLSEKGDVAGALARVRRSRRLAVDGLSEARSAVAALRSDVPPLAEAVAVLADHHGRDHEVRVDFRTDGEPRPVSSAATVSLLGAAREALTNAAKHAPGAPVTIALAYEADAVRLDVRNGPPPPDTPTPDVPTSDAPTPDAPATALPTPSTAPSTERSVEGSIAPVDGYGLTGMRERLALVGGTLSAGPGHGTSWRVHAEVPA
ncbi:sensor histidine kinase [Solihabitans fulvus]|uniref:histidine kinase n=1 Tax=Solihabitans fulvus TaxID=1892852 RepID=A0A5B2XGS9_9PSEU|nr:histidine kinase [Solihabitans fulvus]KAA2262255.1 sensor histidine kinase [Solihabitans fulvus]